MKLQPVYIYDMIRTPRGRGHHEKGGLRDISPIQLLETLYTAMEKRNDLDTGLVEEIAIGCSATSGEQSGNLARISSLYAGWKPTANGVTVSSFCTSGLEAFQMAAMKIALGSASCAVAGGVESMSRIPMFSEQSPWYHDPEVARRSRFVHMGLSADLIANLEGFTRGQLNDYTMTSYQRALDAWATVAYKRQIIPVVKDGKPVLISDEGIKLSQQRSGLDKLEPIFNAERDSVIIEDIKQKAGYKGKFNNLHSIANAPGLADAASMLLLGNRQLGKKIGRKPVARVRHFASAAIDAVEMLTGVVDATSKLLRQADLKLKDIHLFEVNESFAAVPLKFMKTFDIPTDRINISGGAIALGHPLGATGGILIQTLIHNLQQRGKKRGLITICGGAGIAQATLLEVL